MKTTRRTFKTFPDFSRLNFEDKKEYEHFILGHPPVSDLSFSSVMTWWNTLDSISVAELNGNLVVPYWIAGNEAHSGLSLVGTDSVDETLCVIFDHLREKGEPVRLVNVPEFVVNEIQYYDIFTIKPERQYDEYIYSLSQFYPLKNAKRIWRHRVKKLLARLGEDKVKVSCLELNVPENRKLLLDALDAWQHKSINNYGSHETEAVRKCIEHVDELELDNVCVFYEGELLGFCLYEVPHDRRYVTIHHVKATHRSTLGFELIGYLFCKWFVEHGASLINLNADFGILRLRMFMLTLGPLNFFRKYTIEPKNKDY